ncbi:hypothetical protein AB1L42_00135 [Thalassoglobus sp. JC818]|uniref:hypothetical protein n=1 Tax=Thalassoglobus sp. JC818 TaxID=3232136 RepID=UPI003457DA79
MKRFVKSLVLLSATCVIVMTMLDACAQNVAPIPTETKRDAIRNSMQSKSKAAQSILPALVMNDFAAIEATAAKLKQTSLQSPEDIEGDQTENEIFRHFRLEFLRLSTQLEQMAKDENLEGAAYAYENLTANCLACHSYLNNQSE